ncbi:hypothetical protein [Paraburkholderia caribensis]|uniref:hypothetical protein n=1 Tax=Paraburkholderia caribensis TaxID=75105 RepID=UPI0031E39F33
MDIVLWEGELLFGRVSSKGKKSYHRVVWVDKDHQIVYVRPVFAAVPDNGLLAKKYSKQAIEDRIKAEKLVEVEECIRPGAMSEPLQDPLKEAEAANIQGYRRRLLGVLITPEGRRRFYAGCHERAKILGEQEKRAGVTRQRLLTLLNYYENFGCNAVALRPFPQSATRKRGPTVGKRGVRNQFEREDAKSPLRGHAVTRWALRHIHWAIWNLVIILGFTYEDARVLMHRMFWHQENGSYSEGNRVQYQVSRSKSVTSEQFGYYVRRYKKRPEKLRRLVGSREWRDVFAGGRGSAADIAIGPGDILVLDATIAKFEIVSAFTGRPIGRPTLIIVADAYYGTILSIHITTNPESVNGYRAALFRACTSQKKLMQRLGLPDDFFEFNVRPSEIFGDRKPGKSKQFRQMIVGSDSLAIALMVAPIGCGRAKGVVEGLINVITKRLKSIHGGFTRERTERAKGVRREARLVAHVTRRRLLQYAYEAAKDYNSKPVTNRLTPEDRIGLVEASREGLFKNAMTTLHQRPNSRLTDIDIYTALLETVRPPRMNKRGVHHRSAWFTSDVYRQSYENEIAKCLGDRRKLPFLTILKDPDDPTILFWKRGPGDIVVLKCSRTDAKRWEDVLEEDVEIDMASQDIKTEIRYKRATAFDKPVRSYLLAALAKSRSGKLRAASEIDSLGRSDEREAELREASLQSKTLSDQIKNGKHDNAPEERVASTVAATDPRKHGADPEPIDEVQEVRRRLEEELQEDMDEFLKPKFEGG